MLGNNFEQLMAMVANDGFSVFTALFNKMSVVLDLCLNPDLPNKMKEIFGGMLTAMHVPVDMMFAMVNAYKKVDLNF